MLRESAHGDQCKPLGKERQSSGRPSQGEGWVVEHGPVLKRGTDSMGATRFEAQMVRWESVLGKVWCV